MAISPEEALRLSDTDTSLVSSIEGLIDSVLQNPDAYRLYYKDGSFDIWVRSGVHRVPDQVITALVTRYQQAGWLTVSISVLIHTQLLVHLKQK